MQNQTDENQLAGFLLLHKPQGVTSFQCVDRIKKIIKDKIKIGHAGTLDPFATGLLIIAITRQATKHLKTLLTLDKQYTVKGKLGELTDTLDYTGEIVKTESALPITKEQLEHAIKMLGKEYLQVPPIYSALKYRGQPLYKLVRQGKVSEEELQIIAEQKSKKVTLHEIELLDFSLPFFTIQAHVSHGTYVRSLVNDLARQLDIYATTYELTRTNIGSFSVDDAIGLEELCTIEDVKKNMIPIQVFLNGLEPKD